jgi:hypothetical protein
VVSGIICGLQWLVMQFILFISMNNLELTVDNIFIKLHKFSQLGKVQKNTGSRIFTALALRTLLVIVIDMWPVNSKDKFRIATSEMKFV